MGNEFALKKIKPSDKEDKNHVELAFPADLLFTKAYAYDASNNLEYIGYALPGTGKGEPNWLIKKITYSSNTPTDEQFAGGTAEFDKIWNNRGSLSYS